MKKLLLAGLALSVIIGCKDQRYTQNSPEIDTVKAIIQSYNDSNWEGITKHYSDTASIYFNTTTAAIKPSGIADFHSQNDGNFSKRGFTNESLEFEMVKTDENNTWVNFWGTWKATFKANNSQLEIPVHLTAKFIDGKIVEEHGLWDNAPIVLALQEIEKERMQAADFITNKAIIQSCYDNFASGNVGDFLATLDPGVEWHEAENFIYYKEGGYKGVDELVKNVLERLGAEWEYWNLVDLKVRDMADNQVLATGRYQAKSKKNGNTIDAQMAHLWTLKSGKVVKFEQFVDTKQVAEAYQ